MRRTKNISKRIAVAILAAAITMTSTSATVLLNPTVVYAAQVDDNNDTSGTVDISAGNCMENNYGVIGENKGTIDENAVQSENGDAGYVRDNYGTITTNNGDVGNNRSYDYSLKGKIVTNNGTVAVNGTGLTNNGEDDGNGIRTNNGTVTTNYENGYINDNQGAVHTNEGLINTNAGNDPTTSEYSSYIAKGVHDNRGTITLNTGLVEENKSTGIVTNNSGTVKLNKGTITANRGVVELNTGTVALAGSGTVTNNFGSVSYSSGENNAVENQYSGTITGVVSVTNYFGGELDTSVSVTNNFSDATTTVASNEYRSVSFVADEHSSAGYGSGFTEKKLKNSDGTDGDTRYYINITGGNGQGTITIVADSGYEVKQSGQADVTGFTYTLEKQGNNYVLNITGYNGNSIELSPQMFGLVVEAIQQTNPTPAPSPSPETDSDSNSDPDPVDSANLAGLVNPFSTIGLANISAANEAAIIAEINAMPASGGVVSVPNLAQTGLSASIVTALAAKNDAPITLTYTVDGITYMLVIPAGFNLLTLLNAYGGIDFAKLIAVFRPSVVR